MSENFEEYPLKTVKEVDYTNYIANNARKLPKMTKLKGRNSIKIICSSIKNLHAHLCYVNSKYARFEKNPLKTVEVDYTNSVPYFAKKFLE